MTGNMARGSCCAVLCLTAGTAWQSDLHRVLQVIQEKQIAHIMPTASLSPPLLLTLVEHVAVVTTQYQGCERAEAGSAPGATRVLVHCSYAGSITTG